MDKRSETAISLFRSGYGCAQAVLMACGGELALPPEAAARLASSFGGGMGRLREVCGAFSGLLIAAGMARGYCDPCDANAKKEHYALVRSLAADFRAANGSIICREILAGIPEPDAREVGSPRSEEQQCRCEACVSTAARLASGLLPANLRCVQDDNTTHCC